MSENTDEVSNTPIITREWFDRLELILREEAKLAGLLGHGGMIGSGREFMIRRVLRSLLPPAVHIGNGVIVGLGDNRSKQTDIILYDPRFPFLEIEPGIGLYYVEGVIATIEVKSRLTKKKLTEALDNCGAVLELSAHVKSFEGMDLVAAQYRKIDKLSASDAEARIKTELGPETHVFAFTSALSLKSIAQQVAKWYEKRGRSASLYNSKLPVVIATSNTIGLLADGWVSIDPGDAAPHFDKEHGVGNWKTLMGFWPVRRQFGWLALRLLHAVEERFAPQHPRFATQFTIEAYLPQQHYFNEDMEDKEGFFIPWVKALSPGVAPDVEITR